MTARSSGRLEGRETMIAQADELRDRALRLADDDRDAYAAVLEARPHRHEDPERFQTALVGANRPPMGVTEIGLDAATLGDQLLRAGNPALRGDALTGILLARAAVQSATELVALNTAFGELPTDDLVLARSRQDEVDQLARRATETR